MRLASATLIKTFVLYNKQRGYVVENTSMHLDRNRLTYSFTDNINKATVFQPNGLVGKKYLKSMYDECVRVPVILERKVRVV